MTAKELDGKLKDHNPIDRLEPLAKAKVPILHIHGDSTRLFLWKRTARSSPIGTKFLAAGRWS